MPKGTYSKIPRISPGLIFVQEAFLLGLFSGELIFGGAYYWKAFAFQNGLRLTIKTAENTKKYSLKQLIVTVHGHILIFGRAYYRKEICV